MHIMHTKILKLANSSNITMDLIFLKMSDQTVARQYLFTPKKLESIIFYPPEIVS